MPKKIAEMEDIVALTGQDLVALPFKESILKWKNYLETKKE